MALWEKISSRGNVDDRRAATPLVGGLGTLGVVAVLLFNYLATGETPQLQDVLTQMQAAQQQTSRPIAATDDYKTFAATVLGSTNDTWRDVFKQSGKTYTEPKLVLFRSVTSSACGGASTEVGPHYCPEDQTIYLDETFFDVLTTQLQAEGGDVAEAYVIGHEVGHHVQNLLGILDEVAQKETNQNKNELSVAVELQADCFAGVWAYSVARLGVFEQGEIREAIDAAAAVGDDHVQQTIEGRMTPENFTHGTSEQRVTWFNKGYTSGQPSLCKIPFL